MSKRNIRNLPLLEAFEAVLAQGSISGAADAMSVTQSAVSKQLSQLRSWLDDELFVRTSTGMQPTPRALELRDSVQSILALAGALTAADRSPPSEFKGRFVLCATDEMLTRLVPTLMERLAEEAPAMRLVTLPLVKDYLVRQLEAGEVNLVVAVNWNAPELLKQRRLGSDPFVCLMHEKHPLAGVNLTLKRYVDATHVLVAPLGNDRGVVDIALGKLGLSRNVCASLSAFSMVNERVLGASRIITLPAQVARSLAHKAPFVVKSVPLKLPASDYYMLWHNRFSAEPRLRWMLDAVSREFQRAQ